MRNFWSFYDPATGLFSGRCFSGPEEDLAANTPEGAAALPGRHDHREVRVNLQTLEVEPYEYVASDEERRALARAGALDRIAALEVAQARAVRDALLTGDATRLQAIEAEIVTLRADLR